MYAVIALVIYDWTIYWFLWQVSAWLYYLKIGEILMAGAYAMVTNLVESLLVLCLPLLASLLLPRAWFRDKFVARGTALAACALGFLITLAVLFKKRAEYPARAEQLWVLSLGLPIVLGIVFAAGRIHNLKLAVEWVADRVTVFLYVLVPISLLSLAAILIHMIA